MGTIKFLKDFQKKEEFELIDIKDYSDALKVRDLIQVLKSMNPEAICLSEYDGSVYAITEPTKGKLREIWASGKYTGAGYFYETDIDTLKPIPGNDAVIFD